MGQPLYKGQLSVSVIQRYKTVKDSLSTRDN